MQAAMVASFPDFRRYLRAKASLLSSGAEDMRAVPTFFVRAPDGTAVWHRGFDDSVPGTIAAIISGDAQ